MSFFGISKAFPSHLLLVSSDVSSRRLDYSCSFFAFLEMRVLSILLAAAAVGAAAIPVEPRGETAAEMQMRAAAVKEAFQFAWEGYYK